MRIVCLIAILVSSNALLRSHLSTKPSMRRSYRPATPISEENPVDEYYDVLNLFKPISDNNDLDAVMELSSISKTEAETNPIIRVKKTRSPQFDWEHWDEFLESELGDLDAELTDDKKWVLEAREIVETRRGTSIWSKKTDEIIKDTKKSPIVKTLYVPDAIASIATSVYIDKTKKLSDIKKDDQLGYMTFRKYMIDLKKRTKKDPVVQVKLEVIKKWLLQRPRSKTTKKDELPRVIMDELREPVQNVIFEIPKPDSSSSSSAATNTATSTIKTFSMLNWDTTKDNMPPALVWQQPEVVVEVVPENKFMIDNDEIFTSVSDDYFVVL